MSDRFSLVLTLLAVLVVPAASFSQDATYRFDVPKGSLKSAVARFESTSGVKVVVLDGLDLEDFQSPGVSGVLDAGVALEALVAGTGLSVRRDAAGYTIRIAGQTIRSAVDQPVSSYRPLDAIAGTRTPTALRDIPQTIDVIPAAVLRDQRAQSVGDAMRNVAGVTVAQGEGNRDQIVIRGNNTNSDFFVNGIRDDQERFRDLYNVDAIEVVQGPAAVLFGRGGAGGIVNFVTNRPTRDARPEASLGLGAYGHKRATVQFGLPVGLTGAFRVAAMAEDSGGFRDGFFLRRFGVNPTFGFKAGDKTSFVFGAEHFTDHRLADRGIPSRSGSPVDVPPTQLFGSRAQNDSSADVDTVRATVEHRVSNALILRNNFQAGRYDKAYANVFPGSAVSQAGTFTLSAYDHSIDRLNVFNQADLVYTRATGAVQHMLLAGVEAGRQAQDELRHTAAPITGVTLTSSERDANFDAAPLTVNRHATGNVLAGYVQDQITFNRFVKAVAGVRLDRFAVSIDDHIAGASDLSRTDVELSPRAGVIFQPTATASVYSSYSYTFLPSGQTLGLAANAAQVAPENAKNYEVGAKLDLFGRRLALSAAVFRLDRNNVKNIDPTDPTRLVLTGQQRTEGIQLSAAGNLSSRWKVTAGYANQDARVTADTAAAPAGRRVGLVPRHQANLWSTYDVTRRFTAGGGIVHQSRLFTSFTNLVALPSFTRADAVALYRVGRYQVAVNVENLFDTRYYATAHNDNNITPGASRNVQLTLRAAF
jgi:catecholate siderophore receptor